MTTAEQVFFIITIGCYVLLTLIYLGWLLFGRSDKGRNIEKFLILGGLGSNIILIFLRVSATGRLPVKTIYELNLVTAALIVIAFLYMKRRYPGIALIGTICMPFAFIALGLGLSTANDMTPLTPAYKSSWLVVHVIFALIATACFVFATSSSAMYLLKKRHADNGSARFENLPSLNMLEELAFKLVLVGFLAETVMLLSGSIWAKLLWGSFWSWDPVESWSLACWIAYGLYIHLRVSLKWRGKRLAWICIGCLAVNLFSFWFIGLVTPKTYHSLDQVITPWDQQENSK